ncbi:MAG TPA: large-conductance mechanosensitive channel protein MscL [Candidatus Methylacidiphilales bacterium]|jgi:large conductance mechanosensitive channel|nr:large-conductance mechanosensitive channel protein MscL [Candidatus Methylacidiphilales bacterium]
MSLNEEVSSVLKGPLGIVGEFKQFISRGNVIDLAVGVIIGGAFGAIINSLVKDVVMPPISYIMSGVDVSSLRLPIVPDVLDASGKVAKAGVYITYGNFLQAALNFLIIAAVIFLLVKAINSFKRKEAEKPAAPPEPTAQEKLLMEIRDLLAKK